MTDLTQALVELRRVTPPSSPWEAGDFGVGSTPVDYHIATILNAVLSGDLIPRADADLAVALMVEKAGELSARGWRQEWDATHEILAIAPASALAELQALRDARTARTGDRATDFDNDAVYQFSKLMKDKMAKSRAKGRKGWNDPTQCSPDFLRHLLYEHIYKGDPVDVANLCMMLRHYDEPTTPKPEDDLRLLHTEAAEAELATLRAQVERLMDLIQWAHDTLWELNPSNYGHDDVCKVNDAAVEVILGLAPVIGETHGHSAEWWATRAALSEGAAP